LQLIVAVLGQKVGMTYFFLGGGDQESYRVDSEHDSIEIPDILVFIFQWLKFRNDALGRAVGPDE